MPRHSNVAVKVRRMQRWLIYMVNKENSNCTRLYPSSELDLFDHEKALMAGNRYSGWRAVP